MGARFDAGVLKAAADCSTSGIRRSRVQAPHRQTSAGMAGAASPSMRLWLSRMSLRGRLAGGAAEPSSSAPRRLLMPADEEARADVALAAANCSAYSSDWPAGDWHAMAGALMSRLLGRTTSGQCAHTSVAARTHPRPWIRTAAPPRATCTQRHRRLS